MTATAAVPGRPVPDPRCPAGSRPPPPRAKSVGTAGFAARGSHVATGGAGGGAAARSAETALSETAEAGRVGPEEEGVEPAAEPAELAEQDPWAEARAEPGAEPSPSLSEVRPGGSEPHASAGTDGGCGGCCGDGEGCE